jgi:hypothetical protein
MGNPSIVDLSGKQEESTMKHKSLTTALTKAGLKFEMISTQLRPYSLIHADGSISEERQLYYEFVCIHNGKRCRWLRSQNEERAQAVYPQISKTIHSYNFDVTRIKDVLKFLLEEKTE